MLFSRSTTNSCPADSQSSDRSVLWRKRQTLSRSTLHQPPERHPSPVGEGGGPLLNSAKEIEMQQVWYVTGEDTGGAFPTFFDTKMAAEVYARSLFPDEDESKRYSRIFYREVFTMSNLDWALNGG